MTPRLLAFYQRATRWMSPWVAMHVRWRLWRGKEHAVRFRERFGKAGVPRPSGEVCWVHAASVGEAVSALPLLQRLQTYAPRMHLLCTTGTLTSAALLAEQLPAGAIHQFVPVDTPAAVQRFLHHWRPRVGIVLESELWPNLLCAAAQQGVQLALVNARMSTTSARNWGYAPASIAAVLGLFRIILAQSEADCDRYTMLGGRVVLAVGNLKHDAPALPVSAAALAAMQVQCQGRVVWVAASLHPGEERVFANALQRLRVRYPDALGILVPRHPERGKAMEASLAEITGNTARRSLNETITPATEIYIADTIGELGLWYRLARVAFIGGSLVPHGGQNPLEALRLGVPVMMGPHMENFDPARRELLACGAAMEVLDAAGMASCAQRWWEDGDAYQSARAAARQWLDATPAVADAVLAKLAPLLDEGMQ